MKRRNWNPQGVDWYAILLENLPESVDLALSEVILDSRVEALIREQLLVAMTNTVQDEEWALNIPTEDIEAGLRRALESGQGRAQLAKVLMEAARRFMY